jgi:hypothetical protein
MKESKDHSFCFRAFNFVSRIGQSMPPLRLNLGTEAKKVCLSELDRNCRLYCFKQYLFHEVYGTEAIAYNALMHTWGACFGITHAK